MTRHIGLVAAAVLVCLLPLHSQQAPAPTPWDPSTSPVWHLPGATIGVPAVDNDEAFAITPDHMLLKVSVADGSVVWRTETGEYDHMPSPVIRLTPTQVLVGEYDLAAFDRTTGRRQWVFVPSQGHAPGPFLGDVHDGLVIAGSGSGHLYAVDTHSGTPRWTSRLIVDHGLVSMFRPKVTGDLIVVGYTRHDNLPVRAGVVAARLSDGREQWHFEFPPVDDIPMHLGGGPVVSGDLVVASSGDGRVWVLDRTTGTVRWTLPALQGRLDAIIQPGEQDIRPLGLAGRTLLIGSTTGYVVAYDLDERRERWRYAGGRLGSNWGTIAANADLAFAPYISGYLTAIDLRTGELRWRTDDWLQGFSWTPALTGRLAIAASKQGLWALAMDREDTTP